MQMSRASFPLLFSIQIWIWSLENRTFELNGRRRRLSSLRAIFRDHVVIFFSFFSILIVDFCTKFWNKEFNRFKIIVVKTYCGLRSKIGPEIDEDRLVRSSCNYDSSWRTNPIFGDFQMYLWHFVFHQIVFNHILFKFSFSESIILDVWQCMEFGLICENMVNEVIYILPLIENANNFPCLLKHKIFIDDQWSSLDI